MNLFGWRAPSASVRRGGRAPGNERVEVRSTDADRVDDSNVRQLNPFTQPIDRRGADPQPFGYISHAQQLTTPAMKRGQVAQSSVLSRP